MHNKKTYTLEQYRSDCAALSGTCELEDMPASGIVRRPTDIGIGAEPEVSTQPSKPSGRIDHAAAVAVGPGPRPNGRVR